MSFTPDLPALERRAYSTLWSDGLLDLYAGLGLSLIGIAWVLDLVVLGAGVPAMLVPLWSVTRKRVSLPRAGFVQFRGERRTQQRRHLGGLILIGAIALLLVVLDLLRHDTDPGTLDLMLRAAVPALPAGLLALAACLIAGLFGIQRFFAYAVLLAGLGALTAWFDLQPGWDMLTAGVLVGVTGLAILIGFLRENPPVEAGDDP